jgi:hypothetical protein
MKLLFDYLSDDLIYRYQEPSVSPNTWVRPTGWLTLPTITSADTKIAGLVAIYETEENAISIQTLGGTSQNYNIDWGDATSQTGTTTNTYTKRYNYASISSIVLQDDFGFNYKQVIVTITNNSGTVTIWNLGASITQGGSNNWLDISYSWASDIGFSVRYAPYLQRLQVFKATVTGNRNQYLELLSALRVLRWDNVTYSGVTSATGYLGYIGNIDKIDFSFTPAVSTTSFFQYARMRALGNLVFSGTTGINNMFFQATVEEIGTMNLTATTVGTQAFYGCSTLAKLGTLTTPALTTITNMFFNCQKLKEIVFTSCAAVTTTTTAFSGCLSLRKLRMPGISATFSITGCNMQRLELIDLFNDLATTTAKTITITNNPGVADLTAPDILIATAKGWTVTL